MTPLLAFWVTLWLFEHLPNTLNFYLTVAGKVKILRDQRSGHHGATTSRDAVTGPPPTETGCAVARGTLPDMKGAFRRRHAFFKHMLINRSRTHPS
jgi:hypothetical protein